MLKLLNCVLFIAVVAVPIWFSRTPEPDSAIESSLTVRSLATRLPDSPLQFEQKELPDNDVRPRVTNVHVTDLDSDGTADILVCDAVRHTVWWWQQDESGQWDRTALVPENSLAAPAHVVVADINADDALDILVAVLHHVWPTDVRMGQVVALINDGQQNFQQRLIADDLRRVTDVQPADFDGDGDIDLAVAEFGYLHGRVLWLENMGDDQFADHELLSLPGCIHVPVDDYDKDGDLDIAAIVTQNDEEVWIFENTGLENFALVPRRVWGTDNYDRGFAGMVPCDLDQDGDTDFLLSAGDNLELTYPCPQPEHGCIWLENKGDLNFTANQIAHLGGTYAADAADMDGDGDTDVVLVSMFNDWKSNDATSLAWLENDGHQNFNAWHIASAPTHLCTVDCADINGDGADDIVAGSLQIYPPYDSESSGVSIWLTEAGGRSGQ